MAMDATMQIRMDRELKANVEALYRNLGTTFSEAVRIFAQQSLREGGMPFVPSLKCWQDMTQEEINVKLEKSISDISSGRIYSQDDLDQRIRNL